MIELKGKICNLRAIEKEDLSFLHRIENNTDYWEVSHTQTPYSKYVLKQYLENAHLDIYETKQLRLVIENKETCISVGMIDLFDFNPQHQRVGVGILIDSKYQNNGFASDALEILINYCFYGLQLHQLYANITPDNINSLALFEKNRFKRIGIKKDWLKINNQFKDEILLQRIHE